MTDESFPPFWDRGVHVVVRTRLTPTTPFVLWCGEHHRIINAYESGTDAAIAAHRHHDHGGHRTMPTQNITDDPTREALVEWIAEQTGETNPVDVRLTAAGDELVCTYKHGDPLTYAALVVDYAMRALIEEHVQGLSDQDKADAYQSRSAER